MTCAQDRCVKPRVSMNEDDAGAAPGPLCVATSFDTACRSYCLAFCRSQAAFCKMSRCLPDACEPNGGSLARNACEATCGTELDPTACVRDLCVAQTRVACESFWTQSKGDGGTMEPTCFDEDPACQLAR
jgi:hypothetical protein